MAVKSKPVSNCFLQAPEWNVLRDSREIERRNKGGKEKEEKGDEELGRWFSG